MAEAVERRGAVPHHGRRRELRVIAEGLGETLEEAVRRDGLGEHLPHASARVRVAVHCLKILAR